MLTYLLAFAVAIASIGLYAMTFFLPAFKRERDLIWSGVGLFYALVLWICAEQVRGGLLLGQIASVAMIGWLGWQAFGARWTGLSAADKAQAKVLTDIKSRFDNIKLDNLKLDNIKLDNLKLDKLGEQAKGLADKAKSSAQSIADQGGDAKGLMDKAKAAAQSVANKTQEVASGLNQNTGKKNTETYVRKGVQDIAETASNVTAAGTAAAVDAVTAVTNPVADPIAEATETVSKPAVDVKQALADAAEAAKATIADEATEVAATTTETAKAVVDAAEDSAEA